MVNDELKVIGLMQLALKISYFLFLVIPGILIPGCSRETDRSQMPPAQYATQIPDQESWNSTLISSDFGTINAEIKFGHMVRYNDKDEYEFDQNIKIDFFDKNGKLKSTVTSKQGVMNESQNIMEVFGNVVAHSDSANMTLFTEKLRWDENKKKIVSDEFVTIATEMDTLYGFGFESDVDLKHWRIMRPRGRSNRPVDLDIDKRFEKKKD